MERRDIRTALRKKPSPTRYSLSYLFPFTTINPFSSDIY